MEDFIKNPKPIKNPLGPARKPTHWELTTGRRPLLVADRRFDRALEEVVRHRHWRAPRHALGSPRSVGVEPRLRHRPGRRLRRPPSPPGREAAEIVGDYGNSRSSSASNSLALAGLSRNALVLAGHEQIAMPRRSLDLVCAAEPVDAASIRPAANSTSPRRAIAGASFGCCSSRLRSCSPAGRARRIPPGNGPQRHQRLPMPRQVARHDLPDRSRVPRCGPPSVDLGDLRRRQRQQYRRRPVRRGRWVGCRWAASGACPGRLAVGQVEGRTCDLPTSTTLPP